jgi:SapC
MTILNNVEHGDLRYAPAYGPEFGDTVNRMQLCVGEFADAQRHHPIIFAKDVDGQLTPMVLLGFEKGENLHFDGTGWGIAYIPAAHRRGPFSLTVKADTSGEVIDMLIDVDLDDPRISKSEGAPLFKTHGGNAAALDMISEALVTLYDGVHGTPAYIKALLDHDLLREVQMDIELGEGPSVSITGHLVVDQSRFAELDGGALEALNKSGYLQPIVHALSSLANIQQLVDRKVIRIQNGG